MYRLPIIVPFLLPAWMVCQPQPRQFTGKVVGITDGDTITVLVGRTQYKIRLEGIDAPERGQAFGTKAKQSLSKRIGGKSVRFEQSGTDRYKRMRANIYLGELCRSIVNWSKAAGLGKVKNRARRANHW